MADTYDDAEATPKDRVRGLMGDVSAPFAYSDGRIASALSDFNISSPFSEEARMPIPELRAAIQLLESPSLSSEGAQTIKQGSVTFTAGDSNTDRSAILAYLRRRLYGLLGAEAGGGPCVVDGYAGRCV